VAAETLAEERVDYRAVYRGFADNFLAPSPTYGRFLGQIVLVQRGALSCEVEGGLWVVPPRSALWIPGVAVTPASLGES
jgi:hypothetical protein